MRTVAVRHNAAQRERDARRHRDRRAANLGYRLRDNALRAIRRALALGVITEAEAGRRRTWLDLNLSRDAPIRIGLLGSKVWHPSVRIELPRSSGAGVAALLREAREDRASDAPLLFADLPRSG
jgi:hypothetical protein